MIPEHYLTELARYDDVKFVVIIPLLLGILILYFTNNKRTKELPFPKIPGWSVPIYGNFWEIQSTSKLPYKLFEWAETFGVGGVFQINVVGVTYVVVCGNDEIDEIMNQRPYKIIRARQIAEAVRSIGADGLLSAEGHVWRLDRRLVAPALNQKSIQEYFPDIQCVTNRLVDKWKSQTTTGSAVVINKDCDNFMMDITSLTILGQDFDTLRRQEQSKKEEKQSKKNDDALDAKDVDVILNAVSLRVLAPFPFWKIPFIGQYLDGAGWSRRRVLKSFEQLVENCETTTTTNDNNNSSSTFVKKVVQMGQKETNGLNRSRVIGNLSTMFGGGTDSGSATLCTAIWRLAIDQSKLQEDIHNEVKQYFDKKEDNNLSLTELQDSLPILSSFIHEIYRYYPAFPYIFLEAGDGTGGAVAKDHNNNNKDVILKGVKIPKGTQLMILVSHATRSSHSPPPDTVVPKGPKGEANTEFCARRYLVPKKKEESEDTNGECTFQLPKVGTSELYAFGGSPRICPGIAFNRAVITYILAMLVKEFQIQLEPNHPKVGRTYTFSDRPDRDVRLCLTCRRT